MRTTVVMARAIALGLLTCATWTGLLAQTTLEDMVDQGNASWMLGKWQGSTDDATTVTLEFSWDLNKHVVVMHGKVGDDMEFKGYSALEPGTSEVKYTGYDNRGALSRGTWNLEAGELTLRLESKTADKNTKMAAVFTGSPTQGLEVRLHGVSDYGSISYPARATLKLKKQN
ncbi:MAG TPA: hypothetical protein PK640_01200 [Verrucomicrobiota bacterium]|nr:hypothetical protein [Verrucomicrobiota bacterium]